MVVGDKDWRKIAASILWDTRRVMGRKNALILLKSVKAAEATRAGETCNMVLTEDQLFKRVFGCKDPKTCQWHDHTRRTGLLTADGVTWTRHKHGYWVGRS